MKRSSSNYSPQAATLQANGNDHLSTAARTAVGFMSMAMFSADTADPAALAAVMGVLPASC